jgi:4,5-dihydroxyphthalate decarboxylase
MQKDIHTSTPHFIESNGTSRLNLTLAVTDSDQVRDLINGVVRASGISITPFSLPVEEIFYRFTNNLEWDISEMSFAKYISLTAAGDAPMVALPVFPSRVFRHSAFYLRNDSEIKTPKDLEGLTVGIPEWAQTAGVYARGLLAEYYGVDLKSIRWVQAGVNQPGRHEKVRLSLPDGIRYESRDDKCLNDMLVAGEIDVAITARPPVDFNGGKRQLKLLFPKFREEEQRYYQATKIFPIMHVIVMKRSTFEQNRWIAMNLFKAFDEARRRSLERLRDIALAGIPMPWAAVLAEEISEEFGGDMWPYGMESNRATLSAFCRFAYDQGVAQRLLEVDELFPKEVRSSFRV